MGTVYGYLCADYPLPDDCRNNTTIAYYMKDSSFIRIIENRKEGTIHYRCGNETVRLSASEKDIKKLSAEFGLSEAESMHVSLIDRLFVSLNPGTLVMFSSVKELSPDAQSSLYLYRRMTHLGIAAEFLDQPWLNTKSYSIARQEYAGTDLLVQSIFQATYEQLNQNSGYLTILSRTESNRAKKNEQSK